MHERLSLLIINQIDWLEAVGEPVHTICDESVRHHTLIKLLYVPWFGSPYAV